MTRPGLAYLKPGVYNQKLRWRKLKLNLRLSSVDSTVVPVFEQSSEFWVGTSVKCLVIVRTNNFYEGNKIDWKDTFSMY